jgi:hypothetical protein
MTRRQADELARQAEGERAWYRDNALRLWQEDYARRFPRPEGSVSVTEPGD